MDNINVLSLFDGISGARQALNELGITNQYLASEVDRYAIQIAKTNHPSKLTESQGYKALGNSFTVPVIKHLMKQIWSL